MTVLGDTGFYIQACDQPVTSWFQACHQDGKQPVTGLLQAMLESGNQAIFIREYCLIHYQWYSTVIYDTGTELNSSTCRPQTPLL